MKPTKEEITRYLGSKFFSFRTDVTKIALGNDVVITKNEGGTENELNQRIKTLESQQLDRDSFIQKLEAEIKRLEQSVLQTQTLENRNDSHKNIVENPSPKEDIQKYETEIHEKNAAIRSLLESLEKREKGSTLFVDRNLYL